MKITGVRQMNLTDEEKQLIQRMRDQRDLRFKQHGKQELNVEGKPTGARVVTETHLASLLDTIDEQKRELAKWAAHECSGTER